MKHPLLLLEQPLLSEEGQYSMCFLEIEEAQYLCECAFIPDEPSHSFSGINSAIVWPSIQGIVYRDLFPDSLPQISQIGFTHKQMVGQLAICFMLNNNESTKSLVFLAEEDLVGIGYKYALLKREK